MCKEKDCKKQPSYNIEGEKALYCLTHKTDEMVNVIDKRCIRKQCKKIKRERINRPLRHQQLLYAFYCTP